MYSSNAGKLLISVLGYAFGIALKCVRDLRKNYKVITAFFSVGDEDERRLASDRRHLVVTAIPAGISLGGIVWRLAVVATSRLQTQYRIVSMESPTSVSKSQPLPDC